jgi:hypothetical protein
MDQEEQVALASITLKNRSRNPNMDDVVKDKYECKGEYWRGNRGTHPRLAAPFSLGRREATSADIALTCMEKGMFAPGHA